jgi:rhamnogalacturonyl hydrolase YesR
MEPPSVKPRRIIFALAAMLLIAIASQPLHSVTLANPTSTRVLSITNDGLAPDLLHGGEATASSLFTHRSTQYAAFYAADGALTLARRTLGADAWEVRRATSAKRNSRGQGALAMIVDGAGCIHLVKTSDRGSLTYMRSVAAETLELGPSEPMTGNQDSKISHPAFLRLADGNLLFVYRDDSSGGDLVLHHYTTATRAWKQLHQNLLHGGSAHTAHPGLHLDQYGTIHMAWTWRDSSAADTTCTLAYARSKDGGVTWTAVDDQMLETPISPQPAGRSVHVPTTQAIMGTPAVAADARGRPLIATYWPPQDERIPQHHLIRFDGSGWKSHQVTRWKNAAPTGRVAASSALFAEARPHRPAAAYLVFRDDERDGRAVVARCPDLAAADLAWNISDLTSGPVAGGKLTYDPEQWRRMVQVHLFVRSAGPHTGKSSHQVNTILWSPRLAVLSDGRAAQSANLAEPIDSSRLERPFEAGDILHFLERAADWQLAQPYNRDPRDWVIAPFYIGALEAAERSASPRLHDELARRFAQLQWMPAPKDYHADDQCVIQAYFEMHRRTGDAASLAPSPALFERILAKPATTPLDWGQRGSQDRWSWCDALFMAPASWLDAYTVTKDTRYLEFMNREWWLTTETLYIASDGFYARDESYLDLREPNGKRLYWSRGNGWVVAGLARCLDRLPRDYRDRARYEDLFRSMMTAVLAAQQPDGLWRTGLLDPASHPARETSGSAFYTFAMAWGINRGLLDRARFEPALRRGWNALTACVGEDGKLQHVQPIGEAPAHFAPTHSEPFAVGAFLLAGAEIHRLVSVETPKNSPMRRGTK